MITIFNDWRLCLLVLLAVLSTNATSGERRAFVLGVDKYDNFSRERQLENAVSDANAIAAALESVQFDQVSLQKNASRFEFNTKWQDFLNTVEIGDTVVFYFSGHGVAVDGKNYLLPRSMPYIQYGRAEQIKSESISLGNLLADLNSREPAVTIMILDACRNDPLIPAEYQRNVLAKGGLASVSEPPEGTFIMYSAGAGKAALDKLPGDSSPNSVYTRNLLELIPKSGLNVSTMARQLRSQVKHETSLVGRDYTQVPAHYDGLIGDFCFAGCETNAQTDSTDADSNDQLNDAMAELVMPVPKPEPKLAPAPEPVTKEPIVTTATLGGEALFASGSAELIAASEQALAQLVTALGKYQEISAISVVGHTDSSGEASYNQALSERRADAVRAFLQAAYPNAIVNSSGRGESSPIATNSTREGRQTNRRVEVQVTAKSVTE